MGDRDLVHADKTLEAFFQDRAIDIPAVGIGAVEHDHGLFLLRAGLHDIGHGADIGVKARADVLDVKEDDVDIRQLCGGRLFVAAVEGDKGNPRLGVLAVADVLAGVVVTPETVLRCENLADVDAKRLEGIDEVGPMHERGMVGDDGDAFALDEVQALRNEALRAHLGEGAVGGRRASACDAVARGFLDLGRLAIAGAEPQDRRKKRLKYNHLIYSRVVHRAKIQSWCQLPQTGS